MLCEDNRAVLIPPGKCECGFLAAREREVEKRASDESVCVWDHVHAQTAAPTATL